MFLVAGGARARRAGPARRCEKGPTRRYDKGSGERSEWAGPAEVRGGSAIRYRREPIITPNRIRLRFLVGFMGSLRYLG